MTGGASRSFSVTSAGELGGFLQQAIHGASKSRIKQLLRFKSVAVNGATVTHPRHALGVGDVVHVRFGPERPLPVVYEDADVLVVDKPAGLLTVATDKEKLQTVYALLSEVERIFVVHRLDRETSGLLMLARSAAVRDQLQDNWSRVTKRYLAVVHGVPPPSGTIHNRLVESSTLRVHETTHGGQEAITHYRVVESRSDRALVEVTLETGRKHQIRVHMAGLGHPLFGDRRYGVSDGARRLALHASELEFTSSRTGVRHHVHSPLPAEVRQLIASR